MAKKIKKQPNELLRYARECHSLSQQQVAEYIGTTPLSVSRWERGVVLPGPHFRRSLCALFQKNPYELGFMQPEEHIRAYRAAAHESFHGSWLHERAKSVSR